MAIVQPSEKQLWSYILRTHHKNPNIVLGEIERFRIVGIDHTWGPVATTARGMHLISDLHKHSYVAFSYNNIIKLNEFNLLDKWNWYRVDIYQCFYILNGDTHSAYYITNNRFWNTHELIMQASKWIELNQSVDENYVINWSIAYDAIIMGAHITFTSLLMEAILLEDDDRDKILDKIPAAWKALA